MNNYLNTIKQAKSGDCQAIQDILSNMGEGKLLKTNLRLRLDLLIRLAEENKNAYEELFSVIETIIKDPLLIEPQYEKKEKEESYNIELEKQIAIDIKAWENAIAQQKAVEEQERQREEEEKKKEEERKLIQQRVAEEKARKEKEAAFEAIKNAEEKKRQEEARLAAEEEARKKNAEEEAKQKVEKEKEAQIKEQNFIEYLKDSEKNTIASIICNMAYVECGEITVGTPRDVNNLPHSEKVESFWILKKSLGKYGFGKLISLEEEKRREKWDIAIKRLSAITGCKFQWPTQAQFQLAKDSRAISDTQFETANSHQRIICTSENFSIIFKEYQDKELEKRTKDNDERIARRKELWLSIIENYLTATEPFEYEERKLFTKKNQRVLYTKAPLTWRVWNAIMEKDFLDIWEKKDKKAAKEYTKEGNKKTKETEQLINKFQLDNFLKKLNEYMAGKSVFSYVHDNQKLEEMLHKNGKIGYGVYLYTKED